LYYPSGNGSWTVDPAQGEIVGQINTIPTVRIRWKEGVGSGKLTVNYTDNNQSFSRDLSVTINSITHKTPSALIGEISIPMGEYQKTYSLDPLNSWMKYPDGSDVNRYSWIIPSGWKLNSTVSDGVRPITTGLVYSITVTTKPQ